MKIRLEVPNGQLVTEGEIPKPTRTGGGPILVWGLRMFLRVDSADREAGFDEDVVLYREVLPEVLLPGAGDEFAAVAERVERYLKDGRCGACGWTLAGSQAEGCIPGDCSYRPDDPKEKAIRSANLEYIKQRETA